MRRTGLIAKGVGVQLLEKYPSAVLRSVDVVHPTVRDEHLWLHKEGARWNDRFSSYWSIGCEPSDYFYGVHLWEICIPETRGDWGYGYTTREVSNE